MDAVSQVLADRAQTERLTGMVMVSFAVHVTLLAAFAFVPGRWQTTPDDTNVMVISLGGPEGPVQGKNAISSKPVEVAAPDATPKTAAPPAPAKPEMVEPIKAAKPEPKTVVKPKDDKPTRSTRTTPQGPEVKAGASRVDTQGPAVPWGGLATGGGGDGAITTDIADFCCPEYLTILKRTIYGNWQKKQGQAAVNQVRFVINRDGTITDVVLEKSAGQFLDMASQRAIVQTQRLPPLPAAFTPPRLTVHLEFEYIR